MKFASFARTAASAFTLALACVLPAQAQPYTVNNAVSGQGTWETTLLGRDINRNAVAATDASAVYLYDTTLQVTWLRNANVNGAMTWDDANAWAANLSTGSGGNTISDWRLPTMTVANPNSNYSYNGSTDSGDNVPGSSSEMASLFFNTLGNKSYVDTSGNYPQAGYGLTNTGSFQNMRSPAYWLGTEHAPNPVDAWGFVTYRGLQGAGPKNGYEYALAVRPGDVSPAPEPETYLMLLMGLGVVGAISRRRS